MAAAKKTKKPVKLPKGYVPTEDEKFMNPKQKEYFRQKLLAWKADVVEQTKETVAFLQQENVSLEAQEMHEKGEKVRAG